jgi:trigger factor
MPTVTQENIGANHEKITVKLQVEDYMPSFEKALKQYAKNANIPGFRKGMVPAGLVKKQYGQSVFSDEVMRVASASLEKHLIDNKAEIFAQPIPAASQENVKFDYNNPVEFTFEFEVGTKPAFTIPLLSGSETIPFHKIIVSDEMLNDEVEKLQYKAGNMTDPEEITSEDNVLNIIFEETDENGSPIEGGIKKDNSLLAKYFSSELFEKLKGKKANDTINLHLKNAFDEKILPAILKDLDLDPADASSKEKHFNMQITKVGLVEKAELSKDMFDKIYPGRNIETEQQFKDELKAEIQQYWNMQSRNRMHNEIFERLVHETPIELPVNFLKRWMSVGGEKYKSLEQVDKEFGSFEHQLRWQLISDRVIEESKIQVSNDEMEMGARSQIMSYFSQMGSMPQMDEEWVGPFVKKQLADKKYADELHNRIVTDKLFNQLESQLTIQETEVSLEEFSKLPTSHHHHH